MITPLDIQLAISGPGPRIELTDLAIFSRVPKHSTGSSSQ
jgi:hypothetical protein